MREAQFLFATIRAWFGEKNKLLRCSSISCSRTCLRVEELEPRVVPDATVLLPPTGGAYQVTTDGNNLVVGQGTLILLNTPVDHAGLITIQGSPANETIDLQLAKALVFSEKLHLVLDGGGGRDTVTMHGSDLDDSAVMSANNSEISSTVYEVQLSNINIVNVFGGGGNNSAQLADSAEDETSIMTPTYSSISGNETKYKIQVNGFQSVKNISTGGGYDVAWIYGGSGTDELLFSPELKYMRQLNSYYNEFKGYDLFKARGSNDLASLVTGSGQNNFVGSGAYAWLYGDSVKRDALDLNGFRIKLNGTQGFNIIKLTNVSFSISASNFFPASNYQFNTPLPRSVALQWIKAIALQIDPKLRTARTPFELASMLLDQIHQKSIVQSNSTAWANLDAYHRYIKVVLTKEEGVLCQGLQWLYADLLEAFGLTSRLVSLWAADNYNNHASVEVLLGGRWIIMDPTFNISFTNVLGVYLSWAELRNTPKYNIVRDGRISDDRHSLKRWQLPLKVYLYRITYPPKLTT